MNDAGQLCPVIKKMTEMITMYGTREYVCQTLAELYPAGELLALLVLTPAWIDAIAEGMEHSLTERETLNVLEKLGTLPEDDYPLSGVSLDTVADLIAQVKSETRLVSVPADLLDMLATAAEQALWPQEWQARDENRTVPENLARKIADIVQIRDLLKR
nr:MULTISPECIES: DUF1380 family protein [Yersiniaceae]